MSKKRAYQTWEINNLMSPPYCCSIADTLEKSLEFLDADEDDDV